MSDDLSQKDHAVIFGTRSNIQIGKITHHAMRGGQMVELVTDTDERVGHVMVGLKGELKLNGVPLSEHGAIK
jgi:hypothetical protein